MALNIEEQIAVLEEQKSLIKGPGSIAKKAAIDAEIEKLKADNESVDEPDEPVPEGIDPEDMPAKEQRPLPTNAWVRVTPEQVSQAEKAGKLCGYDPDQMIALIRP
jgi:hypothetical protein